MSLTVQSAFICDDVRQEINGKLLFIGVYNDEIQIPSFPASLRLTLVLVLTNDEAKTYDMELETTLGGQQILGVEGQIESIKTGKAFAPLQLPPLQFDKEGEFRVKFREKKKRWQDTLTVSIIQRSINAPTASERPS
jgi:hypothetical protein